MSSTANQEQLEKAMGAERLAEYQRLEREAEKLRREIAVRLSKGN